MRCSRCGRDIDAIGQDNCSCIPSKPLCEDCAVATDDYPEYPDHEEEGIE